MTDETVSSDPFYLQTVSSPSMAPPSVTAGPVYWVRTRLFAGVGSTILTLLGLALIVWLVPQLVRYLFIDAVWRADDATPCRVQNAGACWAFVYTKLDFFRYATYPVEQRWRVDTFVLLGAVLIGALLWPQNQRGPIGTFFYLVALPLFTFALIPGPYAAVTMPWPSLFILALAFALAAALWFGRASTGVLALLFFVIYPIVTLILLYGLPLLGLPVVETYRWGGLFVSLIFSVIGIVFSLPLGVLLALGRRSRLPIIRTASIAFIEFVRGVPLITVLFMAGFMLPLFVPDWLVPTPFVRPLIGIALFASAYMAEIIRGGLQAMPKGQFEGASALGLGYWKTMRLIILPQALRIVIPGIVNTFIGLFKDTTLVFIVSIFDFLNAIENQNEDQLWKSAGSLTAGYIFAAMIYWIFCFGMSRYSLMMERRLDTGRRH